MGKGIAYWHVVKSFFKSTTFKRHLNIYSNFTFYLFFFVCKPCVLFRWSLNVFSHTNQFRLTHSRLMPQNDRLKYWTKAHISIDRSNSFNQNFYPKRKKHCVFITKNETADYNRTEVNQAVSIICLYSLLYFVECCTNVLFRVRVPCFRRDTTRNKRLETRATAWADPRPTSFYQ